MASAVQSVDDALAYKKHTCCKIIWSHFFVMSKTYWSDILLVCLLCVASRPRDAEEFHATSP